jgi:chromosome segregation ATPase
MGRDATITFEQVSAVADAMKVAGTKPTSRSVRERLGNTGSMGTINKLLGRWKSGQDRQINAALVLPPALQRVLLEFMDTELTAARTTLESELVDQQQEASDLATENERQMLENESQGEAIELLRAEVAAHKGRAGQLEADLAVTRDDAARERSGAELARTELAKAQLRLEAMPRLEVDLVAARATLDAERVGRQQAEQHAAVLTAKLEATERRASEADARTAKSEAASAQAAEKAEIKARELITANVKLEAAVQTGQSRLESAARELEGAKNQVATLQGQVETLMQVGKLAGANRPVKAP